MTIETEVAALTTATTTLLSAVNVAKSTLDASTAAASASAGTAATHAGTATTQAGTATTQAGIATTKAGEASTHASTATTQAGIATTKAGEANASAIAAAASAATTASAIVTERTATATLTNKTLTSPDINGGTVDGAVIGGAVPAAGSFTTLSASGNITAGGPDVGWKFNANVAGTDAIRIHNTSGIGNRIAFSDAEWAGRIRHEAGAMSIDVNGDIQAARFSSTGLSVTGGISATGALTTAGLKEDASGNLGLGVVPSAWGYGKSLQLSGYSGVYGSASEEFGYVQNATYSGGMKYGVSGVPAAAYSAYRGVHTWSTAPSGTAGQPISFTQALTLSAAGNLLLGGTSDPGGAKVLYIANGTVPGTPSGGGVIYVDAGALKYKGSSGTVTTLGAA